MRVAPWWAVLGPVLGLACAGALTAPPVLADTVRLQGSAGFAREVIDLYRNQIEDLSGHRLKLTPTTSPDGLIALLKGKADLAMVWAPLDRVVADLRKSNPALPFSRLHEFSVTRSPVAYPVNPANPVRSLSPHQLTDILTGKTENWRELGGPDAPIHVVLLRNGGAPKSATEQLLLRGHPLTPRSATVVESDPAMIRAIARDLGALGICRANLVVNILPSLRTSLLVHFSFSFVTLDDPNDAARAVIVATRSAVFGEMP